MLSGDFKAQERTRRVLKKGVDLRQAVEAMVARAVRAIVIDPLIGFIEQKCDFVRLKPCDPGQVAVGKERRSH